MILEHFIVFYVFGNVFITAVKIREHDDFPFSVTCHNKGFLGYRLGNFPDILLNLCCGNDTGHRIFI